MKYFKVIYLPHHRHDKEWIVMEAESIAWLQKNFMGGVIIDIESITKEEYEESLY